MKRVHRDKLEAWLVGVGRKEIPDGKRFGAKKLAQEMGGTQAGDRGLSIIAGRVDAQFGRAMKRAGLSRAAGKATSPMHEAARWGNLEALEVYVTKKNVDRKDERGYTALHRAIVSEAGTPECVRYLLDYGADVSSPSPTGRYPIHMAAMSGGRQVLREVISHYLSEGIDLDVRDEDGHTALGWTVYTQQFDCAYALTSDGADPGQELPCGLDCVGVARKRGFTSLADFLEEMT